MPRRGKAPRRVSMVSGGPDLLGWFDATVRTVAALGISYQSGNLSARANGRSASKGRLGVKED
jgi:hypothetical protein